MRAQIVPPSYYSKLSAWLRGHIIPASLIVLFCSVCPRARLALRADPAELIKAIPDTGTYLFPAQSLIQQGAFPNKRGEPEVGRMPGYPAFIAVILMLVGQDLRNALIVQAIVLSSGDLVLYLLARRILPPLMAFIGSLLAAFSPWGAFFAGVPLTKGLFLVVLILIFLVMKLIQEADNPAVGMPGAAFVGMLTGAAVLVRPLWPLVILIVGALFISYGPSRKGVWLLLIAMLVCAATPLWLWKARNWHQRQFDGLSDVPGVSAWKSLGSRVKAQVNGQDLFMVLRASDLEESSWGLSIQEADDER
jgi:hypothetical protein